MQKKVKNRRSAQSVTVEEQQGQQRECGQFIATLGSVLQNLVKRLFGALTV